MSEQELKNRVGAPRKKVRKMEAFTFRHSPEMREFAENKAAETNKDLASFTRDAYNAGLEVLYGVKVTRYRAILPEKKAA